MSNVTLEAIAELLKIEIDPVKTTLSEVTKTLAIHTGALETLLTDKKRDEKKLVEDDRLEYLEKWAKQVSQKLGVEFRP